MKQYAYNLRPPQLDANPLQAELFVINTRKAAGVTRDMLTLEWPVTPTSQSALDAMFFWMVYDAHVITYGVGAPGPHGLVFRHHVPDAPDAQGGSLTYMLYPQKWSLEAEEAEVAFSLDPSGAGPIRVVMKFTREPDGIWYASPVQFSGC